VRRLIERLAAGAFLALAAGLGVPAAAQASTCATAHGVTVVVDFHQLGGGVQTACDGQGGGRTAATQLTDVGHVLTYAQRQPGFVCRVDGAPSSDPCVNTSPADAFWSLWWSDGTSDTWSYSSAGVGSLQVPDGGYVALSWQSGTGRAEPGVTPKAHPAASPSASASPHPTASATPRPSPEPPSTNPGSTPPAPTASATPRTAPRSPASSVPVRRHHLHALIEGKASRPTHGPATTQTAGPTADTSADSSSGLPGWVAVGAIGLLFAAAAAVAVVRRKRSGGG
jgi:hypothetical protein